MNGRAPRIELDFVDCGLRPWGICPFYYAPQVANQSPFIRHPLAAVSAKPPYLGRISCAESAKREKGERAHRSGSAGARLAGVKTRGCGDLGQKIARVRIFVNLFRAWARMSGVKPRGRAKSEVENARARGLWAEKRADARKGWWKTRGCAGRMVENARVRGKDGRKRAGAREER